MSLGSQSLFAQQQQVKSLILRGTEEEKQVVNNYWGRRTVGQQNRIYSGGSGPHEITLLSQTLPYTSKVRLWGFLEIKGLKVLHHEEGSKHPTVLKWTTNTFQCILILLSFEALPLVLLQAVWRVRDQLPCRESRAKSEIVISFFKWHIAVILQWRSEAHKE